MPPPVDRPVAALQATLRPSYPGECSHNTWLHLPISQEPTSPEGGRLAKPQIKADGNADAHRLPGVLVDPASPVERLLDADLNVVEAIRDLAARLVDRRADLSGALVEVFVRRALTG